MRRTTFSILLIFFVVSCGVVKKKTTYSKERKVTVEASEEEREKAASPKEEKAPEQPAYELGQADHIINTAMSFAGVRYKFGGTTRKGMDCSGLLYVAFGEHDVSLPRVSYQMANEGRRIKVSRVAKGDLLFFKTSKRGKRINHVGLVVAVGSGEI
ncbi:MAG: C40 family peptidase [Flavobacteriaceae bacterium]